MAAEVEEYLAVLKASYDYNPQSEDEIAMQENQILFLLEKVDDDWWRVKLKGNSSDADGLVGLVPAAYVEQAEHTSLVKALYDYSAVAPGELSIKEDEVLLAFDEEDDWLLVQSQSEGGKAGFIPANYVEVHNSEEPKADPLLQVVIPPSPVQPTSVYVDPEDRVKAAKARADDIQTWTLSEVDKKGKKKKGTLGVGNGSVFFASESDKTPVQKWQTVDITSVTIEKSKHVHIEVGGSDPAHLHFNAGSKDTAEAVLAKLESSRQISSASASPSTPRQESTPSASPTQPRRLPPAIYKKNASVHFSLSSPVVIPPREPSEEEETEANDIQGDNDHEVADYKGDFAVALYDFDADGEDELSVKEGERLVILERDGDEWWKCRNADGAEGVVPASYLEADDAGPVETAPVPETSQPVKREIPKPAYTEEARQTPEPARVVKVTAAPVEVETKRRKDITITKAAAFPKPQDVPQKSSSHRTTTPKHEPSPTAAGGTTSEAKRGGPSPDKIRVWHDRTGQFRVEAAFLGFNKGKIRLHKVNGVTVEVPSEKMSVEDMRYIDKLTNKASAPPSSSVPPPQTKKPTDDDVPLAVLKSEAPRATASRPAPSKKGPTIDWFSFFLSAGCDVDDCTRYASAFERDKIDEALLPDITDATMRSLGLREGDIIRVTKAIQQRKPGQSVADARQEQVRLDEALARQLQAEENNGVPFRNQSAPNIFAGPQGALKSQRRGRPQPTKTPPPASVDLNAISTASETMQRTISPQVTASASSPVQAPPRTSSAANANGFDDDAWTNRPSSTKTSTAAPAVATRAPSAPPASAPTAAPSAASSSAPPQPASQQAPNQSTGGGLAKTTESDIFDQLVRLSELRAQNSASSPPSLPTTLGPATPIVPTSFQAGLGMGSSSVPIGQHLQNQQSGILPPANGPRGPYAPVPANQPLLQPLVPTRTGFSGFVPTRPSNLTTPLQNQPALGQGPLGLQAAPTGFIAPQPTGFVVTQPAGFVAHQPTGFIPTQPTGFIPTQPTGFVRNLSGGLIGAQPTGYAKPPLLLPQPTGVYGNVLGIPNGAGQPNLSGFNPTATSYNPPPVPPLPSSVSGNSTSPANIFAQMRSGTFASDDDNKTPQSADKYNALRPTLATQPTGFGFQNGYQQGGFTGY